MSPRLPALRIRRPRERAEASVVRRAAVDRERPGQIADATARRRVAPDPLLLVASAGQLLVEVPDPLEGAAAQRHVGAEDERNVTVPWPEVIRRDRRWLAPTAPRPAL